LTKSRLAGPQPSGRDRSRLRSKTAGCEWNNFRVSDPADPPEERAAISDSLTMTDTETSLLRALLSQDFDGADDLRRQAANVRVVSSCDCGCGSLGFVGENQLRPPRSSPAQLAPVQGTIVARYGEELGGLLLFVRDGLLDDFEVYSVGQHPLPMPASVYVRWVDLSH